MIIFPLFDDFISKPAVRKVQCMCVYIVWLTGSSVYMIASTVSSKMLQAMAKEEGFMFEVSHL